MFIFKYIWNDVRIRGTFKVRDVNKLHFSKSTFIYILNDVQ